MTAVVPRPASPPYTARRAAKGSRFLPMLHTTDPKQIAILYLVTAFGFFLAGRAMALLIRAELARPGLQFLSPEQYNRLFNDVPDADDPADEPAQSTERAGGINAQCRARHARHTSHTARPL